MTPQNRQKLRRQARLSAVQALYQMEISGISVKDVTREFQDHRFGYDGEPGMITVDEDYFEDIVRGVVQNQMQIDQDIAKHLSAKWSLKRLDMTLRAIMRAASYELTWRPDVPALVIIDEYVSLATDFFEQSEPAFVNAALDRYAKSIRAAEFGLTG